MGTQARYPTDLTEAQWQTAPAIAETEQAPWRARPPAGGSARRGERNLACQQNRLSVVSGAEGVRPVEHRVPLLQRPSRSAKIF